MEEDASKTACVGYCNKKTQRHYWMTCDFSFKENERPSCDDAKYDESDNYCRVPRTGNTPELETQEEYDSWTDDA
jgi:hypothetical protein